MNKSELLYEFTYASKIVATIEQLSSASIHRHDDGDISISFTHYHDDYESGCKSIYLYTFLDDQQDEWRKQIRKVRDGGLIDDSEDSLLL